MKLEHVLADELLSNEDIEQLKKDLELEVNVYTLRSWFGEKLREKDFETCNQVLSDIVALGYEADELAVQLYNAENKVMRRV